MIALYKKELSVFFTTIIGPLIIGLFLLINGLLLWSEISEINILENAYASMDAFFTLSPLIFLLFIPAVSMRTFSEEYNAGTIETLITKPITILQIVVGKFLAILTLVIIAILPTLLYVLTIYLLGETVGNLDLAGIFGSYIGLILLSGVFISISIFASSLGNNQIIAFILGIIISAIFYFGFDLLSEINALQSIDFILQEIGILYHYNRMSKGLLQLSDIVYFISLSFIFIKLAEAVITSKK
jgi:ABC-2 type transport system permease protein